MNPKMILARQTAGKQMPQQTSLEESRRWLEQEVWTLLVLDEHSAVEIRGYGDDGLCG